jgi:hypothetical protein
MNQGGKQQRNLVIVSGKSSAYLPAPTPITKFQQTTILQKRLAKLARKTSRNEFERHEIEVERETIKTELENGAAVENGLYRIWLMRIQVAGGRTQTKLGWSKKEK